MQMLIASEDYSPSNDRLTSIYNPVMRKHRETIIIRTILPNTFYSMNKKPVKINILIAKFQQSSIEQSKKYRL